MLPFGDSKSRDQNMKNPLSKFKTSADAVSEFSNRYTDFLNAGDEGLESAYDKMARVLLPFIMINGLATSGPKAG